MAIVFLTAYTATIFIFGIFMEKISEYLKSFPRYATVLYVSAAIIIAAIILIFVFRAVVNKKRAEKTEIAEKSATNKTQIENAADLKSPENAQKTESDLNFAAENSVKEVKTETVKTETATNETSEELNAENAAAQKAQTSDDSGETGTWQIEEENGVFSAKLVSAGGKILLKSDDYTSLSGVKSGVDTLKNNVECENYAVNVSRGGKFYFKVFSTANRLLCVSNEFSTRDECENAFISVRRASKNASVKDPQK